MGFARSATRKKRANIGLSNGDDETFQPAPLPIDADGFIVSFHVDQKENILTFFEKHGVVAVANVLTDEQCERSVDEVWLFLREICCPTIERHKPETWGQGWPSLANLGLLGGERWLYPQACDNRQNPSVYQVFRTLLGDEELIVNITPAGLMRPTKDVFFPSLNRTEDRKEWKTKANWLHLDMNPLTGRASTYGFEHVAEGPFEGSVGGWAAQRKSTNNGIRRKKLQGILALDDCREQDGGFHAVPGFQHFIRTWTKENQALCLEANRGSDPTAVQTHEDDSIRDHIQRMPIRKGSLLVWDSRLPHGNFPNDSNRMRIVQYLDMAPDSDEAVRPFPLSRDDLPEDFQLTKLGKKLYGFQPWESTGAKKRFREERNQAVLDQAEYERTVRAQMKALHQANELQKKSKSHICMVHRF